MGNSLTKCLSKLHLLSDTEIGANFDSLWTAFDLGHVFFADNAKLGQLRSIQRRAGGKVVLTDEFGVELDDDGIARGMTLLGGWMTVIAWAERRQDSVLLELTAR